MNEARTAKKISEEKLGGRTGRERPRLRWIDDVEADLRNMGIKAAVPLHAMEALGGGGGIAHTHTRPRH
jgi:hypothetical protein